MTSRNRDCDNNRQKEVLASINKIILGSPVGEYISPSLLTEELVRLHNLTDEKTIDAYKRTASVVISDMRFAGLVGMCKRNGFVVTDTSHKFSNLPKKETEATISVIERIIKSADGSTGLGRDLWDLPDWPNWLKHNLTSLDPKLMVAAAIDNSKYAPGTHRMDKKCPVCGYENDEKQPKECPACGFNYYQICHEPMGESDAGRTLKCCTKAHWSFEICKKCHRKLPVIDFENLKKQWEQKKAGKKAGKQAEESDNGNGKLQKEFDFDQDSSSADVPSADVPSADSFEYGPSNAKFAVLVQDGATNWDIIVEEIRRDPDGMSQRVAEIADYFKQRKELDEKGRRLGDRQVFQSH